MENPAVGGVSECHACRLDTPDDTRESHDPQAAVRAIGAGLVYLPHPTDLAFILHQRLDLPERIWLAISSLLSLPPDEAEELCEAALHDLRTGPPPVTFWSLRDEASDWAFFASRAKTCHYLAAAWGQLSPDDRRRFLRRAL